MLLVSKIYCRPVEEQTSVAVDTWQPRRLFFFAVSDSDHWIYGQGFPCGWSWMGGMDVVCIFRFLWAVVGTTCPYNTQNILPQTLSVWYKGDATSHGTWWTKRQQGQIVVDSRPHKIATSSKASLVRSKKSLLHLGCERFCVFNVFLIFIVKVAPSLHSGSIILIQSQFRRVPFWSTFEQIWNHIGKQ